MGLTIISRTATIIGTAVKPLLSRKVLIALYSRMATTTQHSHTAITIQNRPQEVLQHNKLNGTRIQIDGDSKPIDLVELISQNIKFTGAGHCTIDISSLPSCVTIKNVQITR